MFSESSNKNQDQAIYPDAWIKEPHLPPSTKKSLARKSWSTIGNLGDISTVENELGFIL